MYARGEADRLLEAVHPDVEIVLKTTAGETLHGRDEVAAFLEETAARFHETHQDVYRPLDDERIVVEGRMRWIDEDRILRDDPVIWAIEFRDGLLYRSTPAPSVLAAETILSAPPTGGAKSP